ncbi:replication protein A 70 kDa DNA-binding subunit B-like [Coffea arabica]|uniref:Replication protein A 70 kDa DNA-binding subunit B-like n=1 Tax=Coffea arabica TaxID=13443 RepID=A0A6P6VDT8_COFAR|nr:replication protein A 70 kDa DNA-binding subunit B-like [Coffea arabica]
MVNLLCIADIRPRMRGWSAHVTVQEKMHVASSQKSPTRYQKFVFADEQGSRVEGIMFNAAIEKMGTKLHVFKKYLISNADVREIEERYQTNGLTMQWVISTQTVVEELNEQGSIVLPSEFAPISFKDLASYADSKSQTVDIMAVVVDAMPVVPIKNDSQESFVQRFLIVNEEMVPTVLSLWNAFVENEGKLLTDHRNRHPVVICRRLKVVTYNGIALSTRNDSVIVVDPPVGDARSLKNWASRNDKELLALRRDKPYSNQSPKMFYGPQQKLTAIRDVLPTEKCRRITSADYGCTYTCNHCNEKCRFDIDLTDETDTLTASVFGEQAEALLGFTALQAIDSFNKNEDLPLARTHEALKNKMFIVQLKPGSTRNDGSYQNYTVVYYFEENAETASAENQMHVGSKSGTDKESYLQNSNDQATSSVALPPEKEELPSKTRRCLRSSFDESEEATSKKQRNK